MTRQHSFLLVSAAVAALFHLGQASAQLGLGAVGPLDPNNGFPAWYKDTKGLSLDLCLTDPILCGLVAPVTLADPTKPFPTDYAGTFPEEIFYSRCVAKLPTNGGQNAILTIANEAAFLNGPVVPADRITFGRVRIRVGGTLAGRTYRVTTPLGIFTFVAAAGTVGINFTDQAGGIPNEFTGALAGHSGPFLTWDTGLPVLDAAGREYIGNPGLDHTITGSPAGTNFFRVDGPSIGGPGVNRVETNLFQVIGLKSPPPPAPPVAGFNAAPVSGTAPLNVAFTDTSTGIVTGWSWTFGDGATSTLQSPTHSFAAGTFTVGLTVTGPGGSNAISKAALIAVTNAPPPPGLVLSNPIPGAAGIANTLTLTGARPNAQVSFFTGQVLGASIIQNSRCPLGIPIGLASPFRNIGNARANAAGVATLVTTPPPASAGKIFFFQAIDPTACGTSNIVTDQL